MHVFLAKAPKINRPTAAVFDLDPGEPAGIMECIEVAFHLKELLGKLDLECFAKVSGSKGVQVYVPLNTPTSYDETEPLARFVATELEGRHPDLVVSRMAKALRPGKVLIDWSQNVYYKTTVSVYSLRAKSDEPYISLPFTWKELSAAHKSGKPDKLYLHPDEALKRLDKTGDLFEPVLAVKQKLPGGEQLRAKRTNQVVGQSRRSQTIRPDAIHKNVSTLPREKPGFIQPMQPELVRKLPTGEQWQYEVKWDGYRIVAVKARDQVTLFSRNRNNLSKRYPSIVKEISKLRCNSAVIDGELVALDPSGRPSFQLLQSYGKGKHPLAFVAFDLLNLEGHSLRSLPLFDRQQHLARLCKGTGLQVSEPLDADVETLLSVVKTQKLEGIVAKDIDSAYEPGQRGRTWFKQRVGISQEFVIGGYTKGDPFSSLLAGYYSGRKLVYAGKVKAGFVPASRRSVMQELEPLIIEECPFAELPLSKSSRWGEGLTQQDLAKCVWAKPKLIAAVSFVEWTDGGLVRHAKFLGLRDDKSPRDVRKES
jgi:DNA ligase D-like protein (predicted ligase)